MIYIRDKGMKRSFSQMLLRKRCCTTHIYLDSNEEVRVYLNNFANILVRDMRTIIIEDRAILLMELDNFSGSVLISELFPHAMGNINTINKADITGLASSGSPTSCGDHCA